MRIVLFLILTTFTTNCFAQYQFKGQVSEKVEGQTVYLSVIEDYRKLSRISLDQVFKKTTIDSTGQFNFEGNNLPLNNRIYRIHIDECSDASQNSNHFFGSCENTQSILFIANVRDTISFPTGFEDQALCEITSTNQKSSAFLEIDVLKEEMAFDFNDFRSEANKKLNSKKWFDTLQDFGKNLNEPLVELYVFDFLSDKRNETYAYYLKDLAINDYYDGLATRLKKQYPDETFTQTYEAEISTDRLFSNQNYRSKPNYWRWILLPLLILSLLMNIWLWNKGNKRKRNTESLTDQEKKIIDLIKENKTNKEIASSLFISVSTVKTHINNLYKKTGVTDRDQIKQNF